MQMIWLLTLTNLNMFALPPLSQFLIVIFICVSKLIRLTKSKLSRNWLPPVHQPSRGACW